MNQTNAFDLDNARAAAHIGVKPQTLNIWRCTRRHVIPYAKIGRLVRYRAADLDAWMATRIVHGAE